MNHTTQKYRCLKPKCANREPFDSKQALRMHTIRVHTRAGQLGARKGSQTARTINLRRSLPVIDIDQKIRRALSGKSETFKRVITGARPRKSQLPTTCPICHASFKTRPIMGHHVRDVHKMSLFDLPPYKSMEAKEVDTPKTEVKESNGVKVTIDDGKTTVTITTRFGLKELVNYILET